MELLRFLASPAGRVLRIVLGIAIIAIGYFWVDAPWKYVLEGLGALPVIAAILDVVLIAPLFGQSVSGKDLRAPRGPR